MTARKQARTEINAVAAAIQDAWTAYPLVVELDNRRLVDYAGQEHPFLQVQILHLSGEQLDLGADPFSEQYGQVLLSAVARDGDGTVGAADLLDFAIPFFHLKNLGMVQCRAAAATRPRSVNEWWYETAVVPFWYQWK